MPIPSSISDLDPVAANNSPAGSDSPTEGDDYIRSLSAIIRQIYDGTTPGELVTLDQLADTSSASNGDAMVGVKQPLTGSIARTQHEKNIEVMSSADFPGWGSRSLFLGGGADITGTMAGIENYVIGYGSFLSNEVGYANIVIGTDVQVTTVDGHYNIGVGAWSQRWMESGYENVSIGVFSSPNITTGIANTSLGTDTNRYVETGLRNLSAGVQAGYNNVTGSDNVNLGALASRGAANPPDWGPGSGTGPSYSFTTAIGANANFAATGTRVTAVGYESGYNNTGDFNSYLGAESGYRITSGTNNLFAGYNAGFNASQSATASDCVVLGAGAYTTGNNAIAIGKDVVAPANACVIGNSSQTAVAFYGHLLPQANGTQDQGSQVAAFKDTYCLRVVTLGTLVANLPAAATIGVGARAMVTNATATTFASIVAGGGANVVPVYSDGVNWRIG